MYQLKSITKSEKNDRKENEDAVYNNDKHGSYIIADGMEGLNGKKASNLCVKFLSSKFKTEIFKGKLTKSSIEDYIEQCNQMMNNLYLEDINRGKYGTTLDLVWFDNSQFHVFHVGDSRVYGLQKENGKLEQLTEEDSIGAEYVRRGNLSKQDFLVNKFNKGSTSYILDYNRVTKGLGWDELEFIFAKSYNIADYKTLLMTTDGITDRALDEEIENILKRDEKLGIKAKRILESVKNINGVTEFIMKNNYERVNKIFREVKKKNIQNQAFISLTESLKRKQSLYKKAETIQIFCKRYYDLDVIFRDAIKNGIKEKDNASLILINIKGSGR